MALLGTRDRRRLQKREVVCWVEECCAARWAAGRNDRYWMGESETAGWYDRCATGRERRCWAALLGGREVDDGCTARWYNGCAAGWERGDDGGLLEGAAGDSKTEFKIYILKTKLIASH
jgi:hypothetical protein